MKHLKIALTWMMLMLTLHVAAVERQRLYFNAQWLLHIGDDAAMSQPQYDDHSWQRVTLPHAFNEDEAFARDIVDRIWDASREVGQSSFFIYEEGGAITDDHVPLNTIARIPTADIIPFHPNCRESSFGSTWHTLADDMSNISRNTLKAVGQTVLQVLSKE